jgi:Ca-activated chloride channel homolog
VKFAYPIWLLGTLLAVVVAGLFVLGGFGAVRAVRRFGEPEPVESLLTARAGTRRIIKAAFLVLAVAACFVALAQPQYGRGTRRIPATNLDVIIALDYSKSMYARDVAPNRIERAKNEVARLITELAGARFGAVAFAGEPLSFPLTSDGGAIAQFFRQLSPHDMPIGGTAIARAMEAGRALLERDPRSKSHRRVMLLVTDGEDLEGDPVASARAAKNDGISVFVVQIGGRTPEPVPDIDENGVNRGIRTDRSGRPLTTQLTAEGESQLAQIAETTGGNVVRSAADSTGIDEVTRRLRLMMSEELSERVETVYADVYVYPLGFALLLLFAEALVAEARRRAGRSAPSNAGAGTPGSPQGRLQRLRRALGASASVLALFGVVACRENEAVDQLFTRRAPAVEDAVQALGGHDAGVAQKLLGDYLGTGPCSEGRIGTPPLVGERPQASFDMGLALFQIAERFGARFGQETAPPKDKALLGKRSEEVSCASTLLDQILARPELALDFRAHAHYLSGNLEMLRHNYKAAVSAYDRALELLPGSDAETADPIGRDAAHNRALALRYEEENEPPEPPDAGAPEPGDGGGGKDSPPPPQDGGKPPPDDKNQDQDQEEKDKGDDDSKQDSEQKQQEPKPDDTGKQDPDQPEQNKEQDQPQQQQSDQQKAPAPVPSTSLSQDDKVLDRLERAPTIQQQAARLQQGRMRPPVEDK